MKYFFWICWFAEITTCFFWVSSEINNRHLSTDSLSIWVMLYLVVVLAIRFGFEAFKASTLLVALPAVPFLAVRALLFNAPYREIMYAEN